MGVISTCFLDVDALAQASGRSHIEADVATQFCAGRIGIRWCANPVYEGQSLCDACTAERRMKRFGRSALSDGWFAKLVSTPSRGRKYPVTAVGDAFGDRVVVAVLPRDPNERVRWRCRGCSVEGSDYVHNLRRRSGTCEELHRSIKKRPAKIISVSVSAGRLKKRQKHRTHAQTAAYHSLQTLRIEHELRGLCSKLCGRPRSPVTSWCATCAEKDLAAHQSLQKLRAEHASRGLCSKLCGRPRVPDRTRCKACATKNLEIVHARAARLKTAGLCPNCGKHPATRSRCEECLSNRRTTEASARAAVSERTPEEAHARRSTRVLNEATRLARKLAAGQCSRCSRPSSTYRCEECRKTRASSEATRLARKLAAGHCSRCSRPSSTYRCEECRKTRRVNVDRHDVTGVTEASQ